MSVETVDPALSMSYEELVGTLHGMLGEWVCVNVADLEGVVVATMVGTFHRGAELPSALRDSPEEVLVFDVGTEAATAEEGHGFVVSKSALRGAVWSTVLPNVLALQLGNCLITVWRLSVGESTGEVS